MHEDISLSFQALHIPLNDTYTHFCFIQNAKRETRIRWNEEGGRGNDYPHKVVKRGYLSISFIYLLVDDEFSIFFPPSLLSNPLPPPLFLPSRELFRAVESGPPPLRSALAPLPTVPRSSIPLPTRSRTVGWASSDSASCSPPRRLYSSLGSNPVECLYIYIYIFACFFV